MGTQESNSVQGNQGFGTEHVKFALCCLELVSFMPIPPMEAMFQLGGFIFLFTSPWHLNSQESRRSWFDAILSYFELRKSEGLVLSLLYSRLRQPSISSGLASRYYCVPLTHEHSLRLPPVWDWSSSTGQTLFTVTQSKLMVVFAWSNIGQNIPLYLFFFLLGINLMQFIFLNLFCLYVDFYQICNHRPVRLLPDVQLAVFRCGI